MAELAPTLKAAPGARIVNVASNYAGDFDIGDLQFTRRRYESNSAYRQSKQADRMLTWAAACSLYKDSRVLVNACHPGVVTSQLLQSLGMSSGFDSAQKGAATPLYLALSPEVKVSGR
jgi:NAD(P)-dependent dehydrogenase (short-subunit alcohol dehydrogenase family)